jgi:hypothetical protein
VSYQAVPGGKERVEREQQEAHRRYHEVFAELDRIVNESIARGGQVSAEADRLATFQSVLAQFLQQITPYIDTKVRVVEQQVADIAMTAAAAQRAAIGAQRAVESFGGESRRSSPEASEGGLPRRSSPAVAGTSASRTSSAARARSSGRGWNRTCRFSEGRPTCWTSAAAAASSSTCSPSAGSPGAAWT